MGRAAKRPKATFTSGKHTHRAEESILGLSSEAGATLRLDRPSPRTLWATTALIGDAFRENDEVFVVTEQDVADLDAEDPFF